MSKIKPLVLDPTTETPFRQLQTGVELDIPLEARFQQLQSQFQSLTQYLLFEGFDLPSEVTESL